MIPLLDCLPPSSRKHKVSLQGETLGFFFDFSWKVKQHPFQKGGKGMRCMFLFGGGRRGGNVIKVPFFFKKIVEEKRVPNFYVSKFCIQAILDHCEVTKQSHLATLDLCP